MAKILSVFDGPLQRKQELPYQLCKRLLELGNEVHLAVSLPYGKRGDLSRLRDDGFTVYTFEGGASGPAGWGQWAVNAGLSALTMSVYRAFQLNPSPFRNFVHGLVAEKKYRLVQFNDWAFYRTAYKLGARRLLVMPYVEFVYRERLAEMSGDPFTEVVRSSTFSYRKNNELKALGYFDFLACFCDAEADFIASVHGKRPNVIPSTYPAPDSRTAAPGSNTVAFPFDNSRPETRQSLRWFMKYVWPGVIEAIPEAKLVIGGDVPATLRGDYVERYVSFVEGVYDCLQGAAVSVLPSFATGGVRLGVIEALWRGLPVVASPIALEGFADVNPENGMFPMLHADEFANAVIDVLNSPGGDKTLSQKAYDYAEKTFTPANRLNDIATIYETFLK
ncbi:MAG: glycosyltransferase family 4 protein [bacterium]|nr:glycosyltransferase family 4 protein [bacterium]